MLVDVNLVTTQTIYLKLLESDANVTTVTRKVQEQLDIDEEIVLTDCRGQEICESHGTQGISIKVICTSNAMFLKLKYNVDSELYDHIELKPEYLLVDVYTKSMAFFFDSCLMHLFLILSVKGHYFLHDKTLLTVA